jgi:hypothetical protein
MDADDLSLDGRFAAQVRALDADPTLGAVATRVRAFPDEAVGEGLRRYVAWQNALVTPEDHARELFVESPVCHPSVMLRRRAFDQAGGYRDVPWAEDYDLWLRLDREGFRLAKLPEEYLHWRIRPGQLTFTDPRYALDRFLDAKAAHLGPRLSRMGRPFSIWGAGPTGRRLARALERHGHAPSRFVDIDPRKIGRTARGVAIVSPDAIDRTRECVLVTVGARGARDLIRSHLHAHGWSEGDDFVCAS